MTPKIKSLRRRARKTYTSRVSDSEDEKNSSSCDAETLSSDSKQNENIKQSKARRRKIRQTRDFQILDESTDTAKENDLCKSQKMRTRKKLRKVAYLPKIQDVAEEVHIQRTKVLRQKLPVNEVMLDSDNSEAHLLKNERGKVDVINIHNLKKKTSRRSTVHFSECDISNLNPDKENIEQSSESISAVLTDSIGEQNNENLIKNATDSTDSIEFNFKIRASRTRKTRKFASENKIIRKNKKYSSTLERLSSDSVKCSEKLKHKSKITSPFDKTDEVRSDTDSQTSKNNSPILRDYSSDSIEYNYKPRVGLKTKKSPKILVDVGNQNDRRNTKSCSPLDKHAEHNSDHNESILLSFKDMKENGKNQKIKKRSRHGSSKGESISNPENIESVQVKFKNICETDSNENNIDLTKALFLGNRNARTSRKAVCVEAINIEDNSIKELVTGTNASNFKIDREESPEKNHKRRGTYELNKSVTDISLLKSVSGDNTLKSEDIGENNKGKEKGIHSSESGIFNVELINNKEGNVRSSNVITEPVLRVTPPKKRRGTFDLEESVTDLSVLKTASEEKVSGISKNTSLMNTNDLEISLPTKQDQSMTIKRSNTFTKEDCVLPTPKLKQNRSLASHSPTMKKSDSMVTRRRKREIPHDIHLINSMSAPWLSSDDGGKPEIKMLSFNKTDDDKICENIPKFDPHKTQISTVSVKETPVIKRAKVQMDTPPSGTSTPYSKKRNQGSLLKKALSTNKMDISSKTNISSSFQMDKSITKKPQSRTKMPNFSLIHQKAFEKMENIQQLAERKAERAKLLLSGNKPLIGSIKKRSPNGKSPKDVKIKKQLQFVGDNFKLRRSSDLKEISTTPKPLRPGVVSNIQMCSPVRVLHSRLMTPQKKLQPAELQNNKQKVTEKPGVKLNIPTSKAGQLSPAVRNGLTRFGFKTTHMPIKTVTKKEEIKAVVNKTKINRNNVDQRRHVIKGVRSNRRFELLMKMRNKT